VALCRGGALSPCRRRADVRGVLEEWQDLQECDDVELIDESGDSGIAGPYGALMLPLSYAYVIVGAAHIDAVAADLLAKGSLTYAEVMAEPRTLDWAAVVETSQRAQGLLSRTG
jgi:hypothetical protein